MCLTTSYHTGLRSVRQEMAADTTKREWRFFSCLHLALASRAQSQAKWFLHSFRHCYLLTFPFSYPSICYEKLSQAWIMMLNPSREQSPPGAHLHQIIIQNHMRLTKRRLGCRPRLLLMLSTKPFCHKLRTCSSTKPVQLSVILVKATLQSFMTTQSDVSPSNLRL